MAERRLGRRVRLLLLSSIMVISLGFSVAWLTEMPSQTASQASPAPAIVAEESAGDPSEPDDSSAGSDGLGTSSAEESCDPPDTFPELDLLDGEYLEYVEIDECNWDLVLWNEEGTGTSVDLENPCGPFPDDPQDPNYFYIELIPCEYTLVFITDRGELELVNPSEEAREAWDSGIVTTEETFAAPPPTSSGGSGSSQQSSVNSPPSATTEPSQEVAEAPIRPPPSPDKKIRCPQTRDENPEVYDACREGFVPPTHLRSLGILKCEKVYETDPAPFGEVYPGTVPVWWLTQGAELVGGQFKEASWRGVSERTGRRTATITGRTYGLGEGPFDDYPYPLDSFRSQIDFMSMDDRYEGTIYSAFYEIPDTFPPEKNMPGVYGDLSVCN